ncbi:MAG: histidine kinase dimerization/phospho-acceptor domain-containing protein, partial [Bacteroidales bacterium]|nr:histidine kinase dimerization/phospho-acceptor domain-containing protein [Bacteroidales bacterium]
MNFLSKEKEKKFRTAYFENSLTQLRVSFVILSLLYISFGLLDKIVATNHLNEFLLIRFVIVFPLLASVPVISYFDIFRKIWQHLLIICFVIGGSGIIYMLAKIPDNLFYFGGLFFVFMAGFFLIRLRFLAAAFSSIIIIIIYNIILIVLETKTSLDQNYLLLSNPFFIATAVIGATALYYIERLERLDFHQKELLIENKKEIENINSKLEQQVFERTKEIEQRNKELHDEIKRKEKIEKELIKAKEKAEESDHLKSAFLQNMSHEIRTPMNAICGFAGILNKPNLTDEKKQNFIAIIQNSSNQLLSIVTDILTISSLDTKQEKLNIKPVSIKNLINDLFLVFKS